MFPMKLWPKIQWANSLLKKLMALLISTQLGVAKGKNVQAFCQISFK